MNNIEHPKHYNRDGALEAIDEMLLFFGKEAVMNFCLCNAWKYRYRAADKNGEEDLKKSDWYIQKYKELKEEEAITVSTITPQPNIDPWIIKTTPSIVPLSESDKDYVTVTCTSYNTTGIIN